MGLFDFVKGIGKKNTAPAEPQAAPSTPAEPSAQEIANKLLGHIKALGLPVTGLSVSYNSTTDLATVKGRNQTYSDTAIQCCLMIKSLFRLSEPYRVCRRLFI